MFDQTTFLCLLAAATLAGGCGLGSSSGGAADPNQTVLEDANASKGWFHAKKTRAIWARLIERDQTVETLEGVVEAHRGDYLCRGSAGELWPQKSEALLSRYVATDEVDAEGWRKYTPRPDAEGVMAVEMGRAFEVRTKWGKLSGKAGDFLLKNYRDRDVAVPADVWLVDKKLFEATYERVGR